MPEESKNEGSEDQAQEDKPTRSSSKKKSQKRASKKKKSSSTKSRKRTARPYPASPFQEALSLAEGIHTYASGERVRRLTLFKHLDKSPSSSSSHMLITNSTKYGLTTGSYVAEWLELTEKGFIATSPDSLPEQKLEARFQLAVEGIPPFQKLYSEYKNKRLPTHDVLKDVLLEEDFGLDKPTECVDLFVVNVKFLGLLQTIAGSEMLIPIEHALDEVRKHPLMEEPGNVSSGEEQSISPKIGTSKVNWSKTCFVITPIGEDGSEARKHSDMFLHSLIEPALREFDLDVVRADKIGTAGMITSQMLEYVMRSRLAIVDLSYHNPNAFYEMAIRHACKLPIIQISRKCDRLPFDVNQVRTVVIDTSDIFTLVPKLETYRSEIATQARAVLGDGNITSNPISVFFPGFEVTIPKER
jgi:hypothetical protein